MHRHAIFWKSVQFLIARGNVRIGSGFSSRNIFEEPGVSGFSLNHVCSSTNKNTMVSAAKPKGQVRPVKQLEEEDEDVAMPSGVSESMKKINGNTKFEISIMEAKSTERLLQLSMDPNYMNLRFASLIIYKLGTLEKRQISKSLSSDSRFISLSNFLQQGSYARNPQALVQTFQGMEALGLDVQFLETEFRWVIRKCSIKMLARLIETMGKKIGEKKREAALEAFHRRWIEVSSGGDFIVAFKIAHLISPDVRTKLEDKAVESASTFTSSEILKIFTVLGTQKKRPTPLLRSLAFHLSKSEYRFNAKELIELTYALNELTFADPVLMNKICTELLPVISSMDNVASVSSLVTSLGQMRFKHKALLDALEKWIMSHLSELRPFDMGAWLLATSTLSYTSPQLSVFCAKAREVLTPDSVPNCLDWLNVVHSFAILNECPLDLISSVLNPQFISRVEDEHKGEMCRYKLKLLNLNEFCQQDGYKGNVLSKERVDAWTAACVLPNDPKLSKLMLDSLENFLPPPKYLVLNQKFSCGVFVDGICYLNEKNEPVPFNDSGIKVSKDWTKIAVVVTGYSTHLLGKSKDLTGQMNFALKLLSLQGITPVSIPYTEFSYSEKLLRRVQYLENKIKHCKVSCESDT